jgi:hypothetical protein
MPLFIYQNESIFGKYCQNSVSLPVPVEFVVIFIILGIILSTVSIIRTPVECELQPIHNEGTVPCISGST